MKIIIETVPFKQQRKFRGKPILGDWYFDEAWENLTVRLVDLGDWRFNLLYARHEMDEAYLCKQAGITTKEVDDQCEDERFNGDPDSLSGYNGATYQSQHNDALVAEWILAKNLGVDWKAYAAACQFFIDRGGTF